MFTDIVGSTRLWAEHEHVMPDELARHDALVTRSIVDAGGAVFKHTGDGMAATFSEPDQALAAASAVQRAIGSEPWSVPGGVRVRVAIHSGAVHERDGDMFGPAVNRSARLLGCCPAGAVMVSEVTAALVGGALPTGLTLSALGRVQLRDLAQSELVYGLTGDHLAAVEPWELTGGAAPRPRGWLPPSEDNMVGRSDDLRAVVDGVTQHELITVVGIGGMGKTRVALAAARAAAANFADGVWWCDLAAATNDAAVPAIVLSGIAGRQGQGRTPLESVVDHLGGQRAMLILDNCEHVVDAVRELLAAVQGSCPDIKVLATSQEALGVRGERVIYLASMPTDDAIDLFTTRARELRPDLVLDAANIEAVREICVRLDGIPLAIELASARCRSMSPVEIAARLDDRFRLLRGGRTAIERHRTLEAAVSWSYSLLDSAEQSVFELLAVFPGGAMLDAVASVTGLDEFESVDVLDRLAARSLVVVSDTPIGTRYRQLETLRQFAEERLEANDRLVVARDAHLAWAVGLTRWMDESILSADESLSFRRCLAEIDNLRAAVDHAVRAGRTELALQLMSGIMLWAICRPIYEVLEWIDEGQLLAYANDPTGCTVIAQLAQLALLAGDTPRSERLITMVAAHERTNAAVARTLAQQMLWVHGNVQRATELLAEAPAATDVDEFLRRFYLMNTANAQATMEPGPTTMAAVRLVFDDGLRLAEERRASTSQISLAATLAILSFLHVDHGAFAEATACAAEAEAIALDLGALFLSDLASIGRGASLSRLQADNPEHRADAMRQLRECLIEEMTHRNHFLVGNLLGDDVPFALWSVGDHRTAILVRDVAARHYPTQRNPLPADVAAAVGDAVLADVRAEAAAVSLLAAATIAVDALEQATRSFDNHLPA